MAVKKSANYLIVNTTFVLAGIFLDSHTGVGVSVSIGLTVHQGE